MKLPDNLKMKILIANDGALSARANRTKESITRMKGVTQSYNMYDTFLYKKASKMREKIIKEMAGF